jgi:hypothetical protein
MKDLQWHRKQKFFGTQSDFWLICDALFFEDIVATTMMRLMTAKILDLCLLSMLFAFGAQGSTRQLVCKNEIRAFCKGPRIRAGTMTACLKRNEKKLSPACKQELAKTEEPSCFAGAPRECEARPYPNFTKRPKRLVKKAEVLSKAQPKIKTQK